MTSRLSKVVPESCMVILLGVLLGLILHYSNFKSVADIPFFNSRIFFLFMLPPIVLDAGYFLHTRAFFDNMGTILLYAVVGTIFNTFTVGITLYVTTDLGIPLLQMLLFSCLIAAVDPVAVLAVFEEVHVNEVLYILVFGESLLNDAVTVVLYRLFEALATQATMEIGEVFIGIAAFFVVSIGGVLIGLLWAYLTAYFSKFTDHVRVLEPIFIVSMCYMSYLTAELFHFSGIISIVTCAIVMKPYVEANISHKSRIPLKYFLKMASTLSETVIFMMLGVVLFERELEFHASFTMVTLFLIFIYRAVGVVILSWLANTLRLNKLNKVDQFIMAYGGLRGAVSFSLAIVLNESIEKKKILETTTICVVFVTVFFQGITIKPLVNLLRVKRAVKRKEVMLGEVNDKLMDHLLGGIQDVIKHRGRYYWMNLYQYIDLKYMRPIFMREMTDQKVIDETVLMVYRKISSREHASPDMKRDIPDEDEFGDVVRDPRRSIGGGLANEDSEKYKVLMQHAQLSMALGSQIKGTRRFSKNNIVDETDICDKALRVRRHSRQMPHVPRSVISRQVSRQSPSNGASETDGPPPPRCRHHKHNRNHKHRKHKKVTKKLSDIPESPTSNDATSDSPPLGKSPEDRNLLPKISDFGSCSPQLAMKFSRSSEPAVSSDPESPMMADTVM